MKDKGFSQILLIIGVLAVALGLVFYVYQTRFTEPLPVPPPAKVETVDQAISSLDGNFSGLSVFEEDLEVKDLLELEKDLNEINLSQI